MSDSHDPALARARGDDDVLRGAAERTFGVLVRVRLFAAPVLSVVALVFAALEPAPWRRALIGVVVLLLLSVSVVEAIRYRRRGLLARSMPLNLGLMVCAQLGMIFATGALLSPVVPAVIIMAAVLGVLTDRPVRLLLVGALMLPGIWAMAIVQDASAIPDLMPRMFGGPGPIEHGAAPWLMASVYTLMVLAASTISARFRGMLDELIAQKLRERDRSLDLHREQNRALTILSGEIAHELKNPLASVKGLAALVEKDVSGKTAERVGVLRREADRMQSVLEEFLNFSRPLVPLALEPVRLGALAGDIAALHEAEARARDVRLSVRDEGPAELRCDPRKIRQVLINLVQNALDASPSGGEIRIEVAPSPAGARLRVDDRGEGVPEAVGDPFEPGVTSKRHGSGLGLPFARSLARQHGGELELRERPGGGTRAELTLPLAPEEA